ncbi:MAG: nitroreductase family protein [Candidatus Bathyarchaeia archaeon]
MSVEFEAPLFDTMFRRRTKRLPLGGEMLARRAGLSYKSSEPPVSLNETETALLCFSAVGVTGVTTEEIRHLLGHLTVIGRTSATPCASLTLHLFFTDDNGVYYYKPEKSSEIIPRERVRIASKEDRIKILQDYQRNLVKIRDGRLPIPREAIGSAFVDMVNRPGTTVFMPVADTTREYINMLLTGIAQFKWRMWDEVTNKPAGVAKWIRNGLLNGEKMTISSYDAILPWLCNLEAGIALQNMMLASQAMGMGGFIMHTVDFGTLKKVMNFRFQRVKGKGFPQATPNAVGMDGILEGYCPPYKDIDRAVDEIVAMKWGVKGIYGPEGYSLPVPKWYPSMVEAVKAFLKYVYEKYGRLPKYSDAMYFPALLQAHHIDLGYYTKYYPEYVTEAEKNHMTNWHQ